MPGLKAFYSFCSYVDSDLRNPRLPDPEFYYLFYYHMAFIQALREREGYPLNMPNGAADSSYRDLMKRCRSLDLHGLEVIDSLLLNSYTHNITQWGEGLVLRNYFDENSCCSREDESR